MERGTEGQRGRVKVREGGLSGKGSMDMHTSLSSCIMYIHVCVRVHYIATLHYMTSLSVSLLLCCSLLLFVPPLTIFCRCGLQSLDTSSLHNSTFPFRAA